MWSVIIIGFASCLILIDASNTSNSCPQNERWNECPLAYCSSKSCSDIGKSLPCPGIAAPCPGGCICNIGYLRDSAGVCIPQEQCPNQCDAKVNEKMACLPNCGVTRCEHLENPPRCLDDLEQHNSECYMDCVCEDGYLRDFNNGCIKKEQCKIFNCSEGEEQSSCNVECPNYYCATNDEPYPILCDLPYPCEPGCVCKFNHRRSKEGKCILASECPPINCTRPNEVFDSCPSACRSENCADKDSQPFACNTLIQNCDPGCICKNNYYRNDERLCVPAEEYPPTPKSSGVIVFD